MNRSSSYVDTNFWAPLHGLRGIAVLYVVFSHLGLMGLPLLPVAHDAIGKVGVWIFFVLSAFLLTSRLRVDLERAPSRAVALGVYFVRRAFRIYPLFVAALVAHVIAGEISVSDILDHLLLQSGYGELWAIPVEFKYYFVIPVIAYLSVRMPNHWYLVAALGVALFAMTMYTLQKPNAVFSNQVSLVPKLAPFIAGSMLALAFNPGRRGTHAPSASWPVIPITGVALLIATTIAFRSMRMDMLTRAVSPWLSLMISLAVVTLIYSSFQNGPVRWILKQMPLVFVGEISFSIYLIHLFVLRQVMMLDFTSPTLKAWISVASVIVCATITYWLIERPGMRVGKIVTQMLKRHLVARKG